MKDEEQHAIESLAKWRKFVADPTYSKLVDEVTGALQLAGVHAGPSTWLALLGIAIGHLKIRMSADAVSAMCRTIYSAAGPGRPAVQGSERPH